MNASILHIDIVDFCFVLCAFLIHGLFQEVCNGQTDLARVKRCHHMAPCIRIHVTVQSAFTSNMYSKVFVALNVITGTCNCMAYCTQSPIDTLLLFYLVCIIMLVFIESFCACLVPLRPLVKLRAFVAYGTT